MLENSSKSTIDPHAYIAEARSPSPVAGIYFLCSDTFNGFPGKVRWNVYSEEVFKSHGINLADFDHRLVSHEELASYSFRGHLPIGSLGEEVFRDSSDPVLFRLWLGSRLHGKGLEFGPGANPFPVSLSASTIYADRFSADSLLENAYPGQVLDSMMVPHFLADMSDLDNFGTNSFDYIVASHVIEHLRDPIGAIVGSHRILKSGGTLLLIIPSMTRTFDRNRPLTSLTHLVSDFERYNKLDDLSHYLEWFLLVHNLAGPHEELAKEAWSRNSDIHYHTWTPDSFENMLNYIQTSCVAFSSVRIFPEVSADSNEFYAELVK